MDQTNHDHGGNKRETSNRKTQQPNKAVGCNGDIQSNEKIWRGYNPMQNTAGIPGQAKTTGPVHNQMEIFGGGMDRKALAKKQRATDDEPEPSTSK